MEEHHVCPWQHGPLLASAFRRLLQSPDRLLGPYLRRGMTAVDIGCGMGYFTIPMKGLVGVEGTVIAVDLQPEMLEGLKQRAEKAGCPGIELHQCGNGSLELGEWTGCADFALVFWMLHEAPDSRHLIGEVHSLLSENGRLLLAEPNGHVNAERFDECRDMIVSLGFKLLATPKIALSRAALFERVAL